MFFDDIVDAGAVEGHILIKDLITGRILVNKRNKINFENMSVCLANSAANAGQTIFEMHFGNGGATVDASGAITYKNPNTDIASGNLYSAKFFKVIDGTDSNNTSTSHNYMTINHTSGQNYTDIIVTCTMDYGEPIASDTTFNLAGVDQGTLDNNASVDGTFVFDELGLRARASTLGAGILLSHVIFHPVEKSANRVIQVIYTIRIRCG